MRISDWSSDVCSSDLPENIELNRIQLQYMGIAGTVLTVGRQRINHDDQRFVGSVGWRDNEQTFDVVRIENSSIRNLKIDLHYAWADRTIWGIDGVGANQQLGRATCRVRVWRNV